MNKTELASAVAAKAGLTKEQALNAVNAVFGIMTDSLANGEKVQIVGFGTFQAKYRALKESKNPRTGEKIVVPAAYRPSFTAGKNLKENISSYKG